MAQPRRRTTRRSIKTIVVVTAVVSTATILLAVSEGIPGSAARARAALSRDKWVLVSYRDLVDSNAIVRTGQSLGSALAAPGLRGAVQPFVDSYSCLLQDAVQMLNGPDDTPYRDIVDEFPPGSKQPAWAAILRSGRIHVVFDGRTRVRAFLPGDRPEDAYSKHYSVIRHCLNGLMPSDGKPLKVEVFAYHNNYAACELKLNTRPHRLSARSFPSRKRHLDLAALAGFFARYPEVQGAQLTRSEGLVLYGKTGGRPSLAGQDVSLADFAVTYRAVFHAGDNTAFVSLDPHRDPTKATVNFGGFLEDTHVGSVVLEADKRFKTITSGIDPNTYQDVRQETRQRIPSFMTSAERELCEEGFAGDGKWVGTRFWFYPDKIGVDSDLAYELAAITRPQFTADAERSRDDFTSRDEFERRKALTLSPSIRTNINHLNTHYSEYSATFPEIRELSTVARLMGIVIWLKQAKPEWLDLDDLLAVELPVHQTPREKTQLIAVATLAPPRGGAVTADYVVSHARTSYVSPVLDRSTASVFSGPDEIAEYLCLARGEAKERSPGYQQQAARVWAERRDDPVRTLVSTKDDLRALVQYMADSLSPADPLESVIAEDGQTLDNLDARIQDIRARMTTATGERYNNLVDDHKRLVREYESVRRRYNANLQQYDTEAGAVRRILRIGGGIDLEPAHFRLRRTRASAELAGIKEIARSLGQRTEVDVRGQRWTRSATGRASGAIPAERLGRVPWDIDARSDSPGLTRSSAHADSGQKAWRVIHKPSRSWHTLVRRSPSDYREASYDADTNTLRVAEFHDGGVTNCLQGEMKKGSRIVFRRLNRGNVLPPAEPPRWYAAAE